MASNTAKYKLFKYDVTDGALTFNIQKALNDNWEILDREMAKLVEKDGSKVLSTNDYTTAEQSNLANVMAVFGDMQKKKITLDDGGYKYAISDTLTGVTKGVHFANCASAAGKTSIEGIIVAESDNNWTFIGASDDGTLLTYTRQGTSRKWKTYEEFNAAEKTKLSELFNTTVSSALNSSSTTTAASSSAVKTVNDALKVLSDESVLSQYATGVDANGYYATITYKRGDGTRYMESVLSNPNGDGLYQKCLWQYYTANGTTPTKTVSWTIKYDANGVATEKVAV